MQEYNFGELTNLWCKKRNIKYFLMTWEMPTLGTEQEGKWLRLIWSRCVWMILFLESDCCWYGQDVCACSWFWKVIAADMVKMCVNDIVFGKWLLLIWSRCVWMILFLESDCCWYGQDVCEWYCFWKVIAADMVKMCVNDIVFGKWLLLIWSRVSELGFASQEKGKLKPSCCFAWVTGK